MNENQSEKEYLIPANVSTRFEFTPGVGIKECGFIVLALLFGTLVYLILRMFGTTSVITVILCFVPLPLLIFGLVVKDTSGMSLLEQLIAMKNYAGRQKLYLYKKSR